MRRIPDDRLAAAQAAADLWGDPPADDPPPRTIFDLPIAQWAWREDAADSER
jgi:hypothetical protein